MINHPSIKSVSFALFIILMLMTGPLLGCQSEKAAWQMVCDSPTQLDPNASPPEQQIALARYIAQNLSNDSVSSFFEEMETMTPEQLHQAIEEIPTRTGIEDCPFVEFHREQRQWRQEQREANDRQ